MKGVLVEKEGFSPEDFADLKSASGKVPSESPRKFNRLVVVSLVSLAVAGVLVLVLQVFSLRSMVNSTPEVAVTRSVQIESEELRKNLENSLQARLDLVRENDKLKSKIKSLQAKLGGDTSTVNQVKPADAPEARARLADLPENEVDKPTFNDRAARELGISERRILRVQSTLKEYFSILDEFHERSHAEGWSETPEYEAQYNVIHNELIESIGYADYLVSLVMRDDFSRVLIDEVSEGTVAEAAGLQAGDAIVTYNGYVITEDEEMVGLSAGSEGFGEDIPLEVYRNGEIIVLNALPGNLGARYSENREFPPEFIY